MKQQKQLILFLIFALITIISCDEKVEDEVTTNTYTKTKSGYFYHYLSTLNCAWDLANDVSVAKDGDANAQSIISGNDAGGSFSGEWVSNNGTTFVKTPNFNYTSFTDAEVISAYNSGTEVSTVYVDPNATDIIIAKNGSTYYIIKVTAVDPNDSSCACGHPGKLSFDYKKK